MIDPRSIYLTDMSACHPSTALSRESKEGCWTTVDYETVEGLKGVSIYGTSESNPSPITLSLDVKGWHAISLGIHYTRGTSWTKGIIKVKLGSEDIFTQIGMEENWRWGQEVYGHKGGLRESDLWSSLIEAYWKSADLSGQEINISYPPGSVSNLAYVRLHPLDERELEEVRREQPSPETKRLIAVYGYGYWDPPRRPTSKEQVYEWVEPLRDSDFKIMIWPGVAGDMCDHPTEIGDVGSPDNVWQPEWIDALDAAREHAHEIGLDVYVNLRMVGVSLPPPTRADTMRYPRQKFYWDNQHLAILDPEGNPTSHLSLAFPEVRSRFVSLIKEMVDYGVEGAHVHFNRSRPFVLYEEPVVESFMEKYEEDARKLSQTDPRWLVHRAGYVTQFLRDIRTMLDEVEAKTGKRPGMAQTVPATIESCLQNAVDVETWIKEGLVDHLIIHPVYIHKPESFSEIARFKKLTEGTDVKIYADVYPRHNPAEAYAEKIPAVYSAGADGLCMWDTNMRFMRASEWAMIKRLGHREELAGWVEKAKRYWHSVPLKLLNGISANRYYSYTDG